MKQGEYIILRCDKEGSYTVAVCKKHSQEALGICDTSDPQSAEAIREAMVVRQKMAWEPMPIQPCGVWVWLQLKRGGPPVMAQMDRSDSRNPLPTAPGASYVFPYDDIECWQAVPPPNTRRREG